MKREDPHTGTEKVIPHRLSVSIIILVFSTCLTVSAIARTPEAKEPFIDFYDLLTMFMIPESHADLDWRTGYQGDSPIRWESSGASWSEVYRAYSRIGEVVVTVHGEPFYHLEQYVTPNKWTIELLGSRNGVKEVHLSNEYTGGPDLEDSGKRKISLAVYKCDPDRWAGIGKRLYRIKAPGKQQAYLLDTWSCGSAGCTSEFNLFLSREAADLVPGLVTDCDHGRCFDVGSEQVSLVGEILRMDSSLEVQGDGSRDGKKAWVVRPTSGFCVQNFPDVNTVELVLTSDQVEQCENLSDRYAIITGRLAPPDPPQGFPYMSIRVREIRPLSPYGEWKRNYGLVEETDKAKP